MFDEVAIDLQQRDRRVQLGEGVQGTGQQLQAPAPDPAQRGQDSTGHRAHRVVHAVQDRPRLAGLAPFAQDRRQQPGAVQAAEGTGLPPPEQVPGQLLGPEQDRVLVRPHAPDTARRSHRGTRSLSHLPQQHLRGVVGGDGPAHRSPASSLCPRRSRRTPRPAGSPARYPQTNPNRVVRRCGWVPSPRPGSRVTDQGPHGEFHRPENRPTRAHTPAAIASWPPPPGPSRRPRTRPAAVASSAGPSAPRLRRRCPDPPRAPARPAPPRGPPAARPGPDRPGCPASRVPTSNNQAPVAVRSAFSGMLPRTADIRLRPIDPRSPAQGDRTNTQLSRLGDAFHPEATRPSRSVTVR